MEPVNINSCSVCLLGLFLVKVVYFPMLYRNVLMHEPHNNPTRKELLLFPLEKRDVEYRELTLAVYSCSATVQVKQSSSIDSMLLTLSPNVTDDVFTIKIKLKVKL